MRRIEIAPAILILLIALTKMASELVAVNWDWDIDHMMYFGGRLLAGDLPWTVEFDDKLPVVQALFVLPAMMHSIRAWQIMSLSAVLSGSIAAYVFLVAAIRDHFPDVSASTARTIAFYSAVLIVCSYALLPGGITHINPMAASFATLSIVFVDVARRAFLRYRRWSYCAFALGAIFASIAIGIRPFLLLPLALAGTWAALKANQQGTGRVPLGLVDPGYVEQVSVLAWSIGWIGCVGFFGLLANAFPYVLAGDVSALRAGLELLAQDLNPQNWLSVLLSQIAVLVHVPGLIALTLAVWGVAAVSIVLGAGSSERRSLQHGAALDAGYLVVLCPLLLEVAIVAKHFWFHYLQLFVPFVAFSIGLVGAYLAANGVFRLSRLQSQSLALIAFIVISVSAKEEIASSLKLISRSLSSHHPQAEQLAAFRRYLDTRPAHSRDFLNPSHMYFHWQLDEPRHGFPHAANTGHIVSRGWWRSARVPEPLVLPTSRDSYCAMLEESGPSIVVEIGESDVTKCFTQSSSSKYSLVSEFGGEQVGDLLVFERAEPPNVH